MAWLDPAADLASCTLFIDTLDRDGLTTLLNGRLLDKAEDRATGRTFDATSEQYEKPILHRGAIEFFGAASVNPGWLEKSQLRDAVAPRYGRTLVCLVDELKDPSGQGVHGLMASRTKQRLDEVFLYSRGTSTASMDGDGTATGRLRLNGGTWSSYANNPGSGAFPLGQPRVASFQWSHRLEGFDVIGALNWTDGSGRQFFGNYRLSDVIVLDGTDQTEVEKAEGFVAWRHANRRGLENPPLATSHPYYAGPPPGSAPDPRFVPGPDYTYGLGIGTEVSAVQVGDYVYAGAMAGKDWTVYKINADTRRVVDDWTLGTEDADDHNTPTPLILPDGRIAWFLAGHSQASQACLYRILDPATGTLTSTYTVPNSNPTTYPRPIVNGTDVYLFYRLGTNNVGVPWVTQKIALADLETPANWSSPLTHFTNHYAAYCSRVVSGDGTRWYFSWDDGTFSPQLYYYQFATDTFHTMDGTQLAMPFDYSSEPASVNVKGTPFVGPDGPHDLRLLVRKVNQGQFIYKWDGSTFLEIAGPVGEGYANGLGTQSHHPGGNAAVKSVSPTETRIIANGPNPGETTGFGIHEYAISEANGSGTFIRSLAESPTGSTTTDVHIRPCVPEGGDGRVECVWSWCHYHNDYDDFDATLMAAGPAEDVGGGTAVASPEGTQQFVRTAAASLAAKFALGPHGSRQAARSASALLASASAAAPEGARQLLRAGSPSLSPAGAVLPDSIRQTARTDGLVLASASSLYPLAGRQPVRAGTASLAPGGSASPAMTRQPARLSSADIEFGTAFTVDGNRQPARSAPAILLVAGSLGPSAVRQPVRLGSADFAFAAQVSVHAARAPARTGTASLGQVASLLPAGARQSVRTSASALSSLVTIAPVSARQPVRTSEMSFLTLFDIDLAPHFIVREGL